MSFLKFFNLFFKADLKQELRKRKLIVLAVFVIILFIPFAYQFLYRPLREARCRYKIQNKKLSVLTGQIKEKTSQIKEQKRNLQFLNDDGDKIINEIMEIEEKIPAKSEAQRLVEEVRRLADGLNMVSIQQRIDKLGQYQCMFVEVALNESYPEAVNYMKKIETLEEGFNIDQIQIVPPGKNLRDESGIPVQIIFNCLLKESYSDEEAKNMKIAGKADNQEKEIKEETEFNLEGITYDLQFPTAIINGEVVGIGSAIGNLEVKEITSNTVVLTDGAQDYLLCLEK